MLGAAEPGKVEQVVGIAHNYDQLVDSPAELGSFQQSAFQQDGATYHVVVDADPADYNMAKLDELLEKITRAETDWMQDRPYEDYTFLYHFPRGHGAGGMEHAYGTAIDVNSDRLRSSLMPLASVTAHEFFHLWNVKRIRPQSLEPIDYQHQNDTRALWFSEGVTSTVGDLMRPGRPQQRRRLSAAGGQRRLRGRLPRGHARAQRSTGRPAARRRAPRARDRRARRARSRDRQRCRVRRGWRIRPRKVSLRVGPPLRYPTVESCSPALASAVTERIWACVSLQWDWLGGAKAIGPAPADEAPGREISRAA